MPEHKVITTQFGKQDVTIAFRRRAYDGFLKLDCHAIEHKRFDGGTQKVTRECLVRKEAAAIAIYDRILRKVVFIEQFRVGALGEHFGPWMVEIPAGVVDDGETPASAAMREAFEETGIDITDVAPVACYYPSVGGCNEKTHLFAAAADLSRVVDGRIGGCRGEGEDIRLRLLGFEEAFEGIDSGSIKDAASVMALMWLKINVFP